VTAIGNGDVVVELGDGEVSLRWPGPDVTLGPFHASASVGGVRLVSTESGSWEFENGEAVGRAGTWARWSTSADLTLGVHVPDEGSVVVVQAAVAPSAPSTVDLLTPLAGPTNLGCTRRLVDGYESWSYSGVRGADSGSSFWNAAYLDDDGCVLGLQALDATRLCVRITNEGARLRVDSGGSPDLVKVAGTWGYRIAATPPLGLRVGPGETLSSGGIAIAASRDATRVVEELAALAGRAMHARSWEGPPPRGWESWYQYGLFVSADDVLANARVLRERYASRPGFDLVQLDDGWQRTYGAWWPNERFPDDLGELVRELRALGCRPGLWIAPFRVQPDAPGLGTEHPEWCLRDATGAPLLDERHGSWALDASNPKARAWISELGAQVRDWGFEMVKVDFCYLGALEAARHDSTMTGIETLRAGLAALVDALGDRVYVLGCGMPVLPAVGLCHGNRVGHDLAMPRAHQELGHPVDEGWHGYLGIQAGARNLAARWAHAGRWYDVDPDVVMAWGADGTDPAGYSTEEARALMTLAVVCGGPFLLADELASLDDAGRAVLEHAPVLDLLDRLAPNAARFRPADVFARSDDASTPEHAFARSTGIPQVWVSDHDGRSVTAVFNWDDEALHWRVRDELRGATELWTGATIDEEIVVPAHGVRVLAR
jgi:alpha-galactosidase